MMAWLEGTALATWARQSPSIWAYPTILTLHTVGLGIVVGASTVLDLRLLGWAPRIRVRTLSSLFPIIWWAFALNALTGVVLFMADATTKSKQPVFYIKLALIAFALWNTILVSREVAGAPETSGEDRISSRAQWLAATTLMLWAGAITAGRLMAYL